VPYRLGVYSCLMTAIILATAVPFPGNSNSNNTFRLPAEPKRAHFVAVNGKNPDVTTEDDWK